MAKVNLKDVSHEDLSAELLRRLKLVKGSKPAAEEEASENVELPTVDEVDDLDTDALQELCERVGVAYEDEDDDAMKALLKVLISIGNEKAEDLDDEDVKNLCVALGIKPAKKVSLQVKQVEEFIKAKAEDGEPAKEEASEEEPDEAPTKKKKAKDEDAEEDAEEEAPAKKKKEPEAIDYAEIVETATSDEGFEYPKESLMVKRLTAFNEAADEPINVKKLGTEAAYDKLLELLVNADGEIAEWGSPYVREETAHCCGQQMEDTKFKGDKTEYVKCLVTDKVYSFDGEDFVEKEEDAE